MFRGVTMTTTGAVKLTSNLSRDLRHTSGMLDRSLHGSHEQEHDVEPPSPQPRHAPLPLECFF